MAIDNYNFRALYDLSADAIMILGKSHFLHCNNATLKIFGCPSMAEYCTKHPSDISPAVQPDGTGSFELAEKHMADAIANGYKRFEWMHQRFNGEIFEAEVLLSPADWNGEPVLQAVVRDISSEKLLARQKAQAELSKSEARYQQLVELAQEGIWVIDANDITSYANPSMEKLLGYGAGEMTGKHLFDFMDQDGIEICKANLALRRQGVSSQHDFEFLGKDGRKVYATLVASPLFDEAGNYAGAISGIIDITARKKAEDALHELNYNLEKRVEMRTQELLEAKNLAEAAMHAKSEFLARMSHEIRTPMNGMLGIAQLLEATPLDDQQHHYLKILKRSANTLMVVINDILEYSRMEAGKLTLTNAAFSLNELLEDTTASYQLALRDNLEFSLAINTTQRLWLMGDAVRLHQIITNLLNNAFKFTENGSIHFNVNVSAQEDNQVIISFSVSDTGIGISPEKQRNLFTSFTQADDIQSIAQRGTGLGLAICKKLVELMQGTITLESQPGQGTTVTFTLPFTLADMAAEENAVVWKDTDFSTLNIMLSEDNEVNQLVITEFIRQLGAHITVKNNGHEALVEACDPGKHYDLIIMDCEMPVMDGYEATRRIRQWEFEHKRSPVPICALTAHALPEHVRQCLEAGMNYHIAKPVRLDKLANLLRDVCRNSTAF